MITLMAGAGALAFSASAAIDAHAEPVEIRLVANMGVLISQGDSKVLVDALFTDVYEGRFRIPTTDDRQAIIDGAGEFAGLDALVFTHEHGDHFNANEVAAVRSAQAALPVFGPAQILGQVDVAGTAAPLPAGLSIEGYSTFHIEGTQNNAYVVSIGDTEVLHLGDTNPDEADFSVFDGLDIDVVLYPIWFVQSETAQAELTGRFADARQIAVHVPAHISNEQMIEYLGEGKSLVDPGDRIMINPGDHD